MVKNPDLIVVYCVVQTNSEWFIARGSIRSPTQAWSCHLALQQVPVPPKSSYTS